jgi:thiamine biosynthesis lipoprotein
MASSLAEAQPAWQIGLQHPRAEALLDSLALVNRAVATSGDYRNVRDAAYQQHHIIDPHEGHSPEHFASVSVLAPTAAYADGLATALMVMDIDAGQSLVTHLKDIEALWITKEMQQIRSAGFPI